MTRRTHSSIDTLPADLRETITQMVVDGFWPEDFPWADTPEADTVRRGKPRYQDIVYYCVEKGHPVSLSAFGRWAKSLQVFERMRTATGLAKQVLADVTAENATATQKAAAEMIAAQALDMAVAEDLSPKELALVSRAIKDTAGAAITADKYSRQQLAEKTAAAADKVEAIVKKKNIDPETLKMIREQIYGITQ
ncbi:phage protein Gp27 family protein [Anaerohalosphaeraceae bacterium U12dextr]